MDAFIGLDILNRIVGDLVGHVDGPMKFRLILQPMMAIIFAVRAGLLDARLAVLRISGASSAIPIMRANVC